MPNWVQNEIIFEDDECEETCESLEEPEVEDNGLNWEDVVGITSG